MQSPRGLAVLATCVVSTTALAEEAPASAEDEPTLAPAGDGKLASTAKDPRKGEDASQTERYLLIAGESLALTAIAAAWYWATPEKQKVDWTLAWDRESWEMKLTSFDAVRFDTNPFEVNAFGHTGQAVLAYQIGRGNGLGVGGATLLNLLQSAVWEYLVEYREYVSLNDLVVNGVSGPALAEPLWQVGDYFRSGPRTTTNEALAIVFSPFDNIERRVTNRPWRESARPWHRFRVWSGATGSTASGEQRTDAALGADLEVASFDRSGVRSGWTPAGGWSRIAGTVRFGGDGLGGGSLHSRTSFGGYQTRAIFEDGLGRSAFFGFGTGITYESSKLAMERDQLAAYHLIGPQVDVHLRTRNFDLRWQAAAYGDFGIVHALALGGMPPIDPEPPYDTPIAAHGYYFGVGGSAWTRLAAAWQRWHADVELHAHQLWSLDARDQDRGEPKGPEDLADGRAFGRGTLGFALQPDWLVLDGVVDVIGRRGTIANLGPDGGDLERTGAEQRVGLQLTLQH